MRTIYAEYNINHDSIDVYTSAGYMFLREITHTIKAVYKIDKVTLVNCEIFERYLESFRIP